MHPDTGKAKVTRHTVTFLGNLHTKWRSVLFAGVPRIWNTSIESHRAAVRQAILDTTATLVAESGVTAASMSQIAERAGIGRATLYKYFPHVETILIAWHQDRVAEHITQLTAAAGWHGCALATP